MKSQASALASGISGENREIVRFEAVTKRFGKVTALDDLNCVINGHVNGLIGPNGAGKTTFLNVLLGLTRPNHGRVSVLGLDVRRELSKIKKRVGVLSENPGFPGSFSGLDFLVRVARLRQLQEPRKCALDVLDVVGLGGAGGRSIRTYSSGMYQRLGLAQAIMGEPELIILDEPAANLDPMGRMDVLRIIKNYSQDRGIGFLLSTHILYDVEQVCDWVGIMSSGRVQAFGSVSDLVGKYSGRTFSIAVSDLKAFTAVFEKSGLTDQWNVKDERIVATFASGLDVYGNLVKLAEQAKVRLVEVRPLWGSLDEVFRRVLNPQ